MTAKRKRVRIRPLRPGATEQEIVRFFRQHDPQALEEAGFVAVAEDREDLERLLQQYLSEPSQAQLNIRLPRSVKAMLTRIARRKTVDTSTLARIWIIERLRAEARGGN